MKKYIKHSVGGQFELYPRARAQQSIERFEHIHYQKEKNDYKEHTEHTIRMNEQT